MNRRKILIESVNRGYNTAPSPSFFCFLVLCPVEKTKKQKQEIQKLHYLEINYVNIDTKKKLRKLVFILFFSD